MPHTPFVAPPAVRAAIDAFLHGLDPSDPFLAVVQHSITAIVVSDPTLPDNPLIYVNDAFTALTGFEAAEVLGLNRNTLRQKVRDLDLRLMRAPR